MSVRLQDLLAGGTPPGVYRFLGRAAPETIAGLAEAADGPIWAVSVTWLSSRIAQTLNRIMSNMRSAPRRDWVSGAGVVAGWAAGSASCCC